MPKASKRGYYAVRVGRVPGVYTSWAECETQVKGFTGAMYKALSTEAEAIEFVAARPTTARMSTFSRVPLVPTVVAGPSNVCTRTVEAANNERDCDIVYCDGACRGNGQPGSVAGIGVWWGHGDPRNISERCPGGQTNNRAELIAIVRILETTPHLKRPLLIKTDSNYSIRCVSLWILNWTRNGFLTANGKPVKNRALIKYLAALLHVRQKTSQRVDFKHVRGHVGIEGNEAADQLANLGATKPMVPERDWENLEKQVLQGLKPVEVVDDDLKAYADGLLNDDELAALADTDVGDAVREPGAHHLEVGKHASRDHTSVSLVPHDVPPPRVNNTGVSRKRDGIGVTCSGNRPVVVAARDHPSVPSKLGTAICKEELEVYAPYLLGGDELSTLGKDRVFDSDF